MKPLAQCSRRSKIRETEHAHLRHNLTHSQGKKSYSGGDHCLPRVLRGDTLLQYHCLIALAGAFSLPPDAKLSRMRRDPPGS